MFNFLQKKNTHVSMLINVILKSLGVGVSSADILRIRRRGFFRRGHPHYLVQKTSDFSKFMMCPHGQGEGGRASADKGGEGPIFRDFVRVFLWTAPY